MIKIDFEFETSHGKYADALYLPEGHNLSDAEIQAMKEQRRDNWITAITTVAEEQSQRVKEINGEIYERLDGAPPADAKLVQVDGVWFYKV